MAAEEQKGRPEVLESIAAAGSTDYGAKSNAEDRERRFEAVFRNKNK